MRLTQVGGAVARKLKGEMQTSFTETAVDYTVGLQVTDPFLGYVYENEEYFADPQQVPFETKYFPDELGSGKWKKQKKWATKRDVKEVKEQVNNLHTKREAIEWRSGLRVTDELQLYVKDGIEYLPDSGAVPFTTGSSFDVDNWSQNGLVTRNYLSTEYLNKLGKWKDEGDVRGWEIDNTAAVDVSAAVNALALTQKNLVFVGRFKISNTLYLCQNIGDRVNGTRATFIADNINGVAVKIGKSRCQNVDVDGIYVTGTATTAVEISEVYDSVLDEIRVRSGIFTDGIFLHTMWGCTVSNISTAFAKISRYSIRVEGDFNANTNNNWYTSNASEINVYINQFAQSGAGHSAGNVWHGLCIQEGVKGLHIESLYNATFNSMYEEATVHPVTIGSENGSGRGIAFNSPHIIGLYKDRQFERRGERVALFDIQQAYGVSINEPYLVGANNINSYADLAIKGSGVGATGVAIVGLNGEIAGVVLTRMGNGYGDNTTVEITGGNVNATATATVVSGAVTELALTSSGSGYAQVKDMVTPPFIVKFGFGSKVSINAPTYYSDKTPVVQSCAFPWCVRSKSKQGFTGIMSITDDYAVSAGYCNIKPIFNGSTHRVEYFDRYSGDLKVIKSSPLFV